MLTSLLLCIYDTHFIFCDFCLIFIVRFPLWTIFIISWFTTLCSGLPFSCSLVICTAIWNSTINKKRKKIKNCRILGVVCVYIWWTLLGSYISFTTTRVDTIDTDLLHVDVSVTAVEFLSHTIRRYSFGTIQER